MFLYCYRNDYFAPIRDKQVEMDDEALMKAIEDTLALKKTM